MISFLFFSFSSLSFTSNTLSRPNDETVTAKLVPNWESSKLPKAGDVVTLAYERISFSGDLVTPRIVRVRKDVDWEDVVRVGGSVKSMANSM